MFDSIVNLLKSHSAKGKESLIVDARKNQLNSRRPFMADMADSSARASQQVTFMTRVRAIDFTPHSVELVDSFYIGHLLFLNKWQV